MRIAHVTSAAVEANDDWTIVRVESEQDLAGRDEAFTAWMEAIDPGAAEPGVHSRRRCRGAR